MFLLPFLDHTPNTINYMIAGYAVLVGTPVLYIVSWLVKRRNLQRDLAVMESLSQEERPDEARLEASRKSA
jgi:hypothetical protein